MRQGAFQSPTRPLLHIFHPSTTSTHHSPIPLHPNPLFCFNSLSPPARARCAHTVFIHTAILRGPQIEVPWLTEIYVLEMIYSYVRMCVCVCVCMFTYRNHSCLCIRNECLHNIFIFHGGIQGFWLWFEDSNVFISFFVHLHDFYLCKKRKWRTAKRMPIMQLTVCRLFQGFNYEIGEKRTDFVVFFICERLHHRPDHQYFNPNMLESQIMVTDVQTSIVSKKYFLIKRW